MIKGQRAWKFTDAMRRKMERHVIAFLTKNVEGYEDGEEGYYGDTEDRSHYNWNGEVRGRKFRATYFKGTRTINVRWM